MDGQRIVGLIVESDMIGDLAYAHEGVTRRILSAAIEVHRHLGPGLLESTYRTCLVREMAGSGLQVRIEAPVPIQYRDARIDIAYRADLIVEDAVLVELKAVEKILPIHQAQTLTYLKHSKLRVGLLLNFNVILLKHGIRRFIR